LNRLSGEKMSFVKKIITVIKSPSEFFEKIKWEKGIFEALKYLVILSLISVALITIFVSMFTRILFPFTFVETTISYLILFILASIIGSFIFSFILQFITRALTGKGEYENTYKAVVYGGTPSLLLNWLPVVNLLAALYSLYIVARGASILNEISMDRAVIAVIISIVIVFLITGLFAFMMRGLIILF